MLYQCVPFYPVILSRLLLPLLLPDSDADTQSFGPRCQRGAPGGQTLPDKRRRTEGCSIFTSACNHLG